ncbi:MAG: IS1595 family transposase, partial [Alphaproteobacteria bacterium]|nr:IS1595 family transposase [Alphaproteobacteria bacterium]
MTSILNNPIFQDAEAAREHLESLRWPDGPVCPHCGNYGKIYKVKSKKVRKGVRKCGECRKQFTVTVGTLFERSHVPLNVWFQAAYLLCASKKGMSAHQLHRILGVTYKTAWFMCHRLREGMREFSPGPVGGDNKVVEVDETYV